MGDKLINSFIASIIGCISAASTVWFLTDSTPKGAESAASCPVTCKVGGSGEFTTLVVDRLQINDRLVIVDRQSGKPLIEFKDGNAYVQGGVYSRHMGTYQMVSQKFQVTPDDPIRPDPSIFAELAMNRGHSPYFALLSAQKVHSINVGFDTTETGYIISQNNRDPAVVPQAILPIPQPSGVEGSAGSKSELASGRSFSSEFH